MAEFLPGDDREPFFHERYPGVEMVYVLSGTLAVPRNVNATTSARVM